jgi:protein ImuB
MNKRFLFVKLPYFPVERFLKTQTQLENRVPDWWDEQANTTPDEDDAPPSGPCVLVSQSARGTRISAVGPQAIREGLWPDMKLADARTMMPHIQVYQHNVESDHALLTKLAHWMLRYSPSVFINGTDGFILDTHGCDHLFGGEVMMAQDIVDHFKRMGFTARLAFADTVAAAIALVSHGAHAVHILPANNAPHLLDALPVDALRLDDDTLVLLKRLGLKTIGDVRPLPRSALERRFRENRKSKRQNTVAQASSVQWRLDQLQGVLAEPLNYITEPNIFRVTRPCPDLALEQEAVGIALQQLLPTLCSKLEKAGQGARCFRLTGYRADGGYGTTAVHLSQPTLKTDVVTRLFQDKLCHIDCGFGIDLFVLEALGVEPLSATQNNMIPAQHTVLNTASLAGYSDIISNRVSPRSVLKMMLRTSYVPERAQKLVPISIDMDWAHWKTIQPVWAPRPTRLLAHPEPANVTAELPDSPPMQFVWRRVLRRVVRARGPERILPEWWHDNFKSKPSASFRDYYDVEDSKGLRYWIFRATKNDIITDPEPLDTANDNGESESVQRPQSVMTTQWYVHGLF